MFTINYGVAPLLFPTELPQKLYNFYYAPINHVQIFQNIDNSNDWEYHQHLVAVWHIKAKLLPAVANPVVVDTDTFSIN